jgi:hypothetical protein
MDWDRLIAEHNEWTAHNFPDETVTDSLTGVMEECGELAHAHLKEKQHIRGTAEEHQAAAKDAIGDMTVYLLGVMDRYGTPRGRAVPRHELGIGNDDGRLHQIGMAVGRMLSYPGPTSIRYVIVKLERYCLLREWDYEKIVNDTWDQVKQRDWKANPTDGKAPVDGALTRDRDRIAHVIHETCPTLTMEVCLELADQGLAAVVE